MGFEQGKEMQGIPKGTPEDVMLRQERHRREGESMEHLEHSYTAQANGLLKDERVRDEVSRFSKDVISAREGVEQDDYASRLFDALKLRRIEIPDFDNNRERSACALALARRHEQSLH